MPIWVLHGLQDPLLPYNQSLNLYNTTVAAGNEARLTLVPTAVHDLRTIIGAANATTWIANPGGQQKVIEGRGPSWDDIEQFLHVHLNRSRGQRR